MSADANREGFRIIRKIPALFLMELLWRWSFGLGILALAFYAYSHLRPAILFTDADEPALSSQDPIPFAQAAVDLLSPVLPLLLKTCAQVFSVAAVFWIAISALGRGIITRVIVGHLVENYSVTITADAPRWASFALLQFARVLMLLILAVGYLGGLFIASLVDPTRTNVVLSASVVFSSVAISSVLWSYVNWVLSLAPIFVARDARAPLDAVVEAIAFIRRRHSHLRAIALWNSTLRGVAATAISLAGVFTVALRSTLPPGAITLLLVLETLAYFVVSDVFLLARLAAYAAVAVRERTLNS
jgi:hypothetical protein